MAIGSVRLPGGETVPALGMGTWRMGEAARRRRAEADALRLGLDLGVTLIDTAEMYGEGGAEEVVGEAIAGRREGVFLVSKIYPHNATRAGIPAACARSLKRLGTDRIDLYLLHWRGGERLAEVVEGFERLRAAGHIRHWGVSNFDQGDMAELAALDAEGRCAANQVLYNLGSRGIEFDLMPWCAGRGVPVMAYTPLGQGGMLADRALARVAARLGASPAQVAIAWTLRLPGVISIPKAAAAAHVRENRAAADLVLTAEDLAALDAAFPPPDRKRRLEML